MFTLSVYREKQFLDFIYVDLKMRVYAVRLMPAAANRTYSKETVR